MNIIIIVIIIIVIDYDQIWLLNREKEQRQ